jgi:quinol monooxygenase YgiN
MTMKKKITRFRLQLFLIVFCMLTFNSGNKALAQSKTQYIRIANLVIDTTQLEAYKAALKEHAEAAISKEPGVLTLYAVYDKDRPSHVTVFEIYASREAYNSHIQSPHFLKYKDTVKDMVKSLVLLDVIPIALETKKHN